MLAAAYLCIDWSQNFVDNPSDLRVFFVSSLLLKHQNLVLGDYVCNLVFQFFYMIDKTVLEVLLAFWTAGFFLRLRTLLRLNLTLRSGFVSKWRMFWVAKRVLFAAEISLLTRTDSWPFRSWAVVCLVRMVSCLWTQPHGAVRIWPIWRLAATSKWSLLFVMFWSWTGSFLISNLVWLLAHRCRLFNSEHDRFSIFRFLKCKFTVALLFFERTYSRRFTFVRLST